MNEADLTQLKRTLEGKEEECARLKAKLSKYELAANGADDGLWDWDLITNELFISTPWKTMLGFAADEAIDLEGLWESLLHPDEKEQALAYVQSFFDGSSGEYDTSFRLRHKDGSYRWIRSRAKAVRDKNGKVIRISGTHTDITERKLAQDALLKSELKFRAIFENSLVGMFRTDVKTGEIIESNDKFWEIMRSNRREGLTTLDYYKKPEDREIVLNALKEKDTAENMEMEIQRGDGKFIWVSFNLRYYRDEGIIETIITDITDRKNNLLELQKVNFELDSFVYHASHDLRSPLRSVMGLLNIYKEETNPSVRAECIDMIEGSVKRLDNLVVELLSISRNDRVDDLHVPLNFLIEIDNSISSYYNASNTENLDIRVRVIQPVPFVSDLTRVRIVLNNLISNAIKYRDTSKLMSLVEVDVEVNNKEAILKVSDNGEGIEQSKLGHIFDMFYRATENSEGSGLGLYIVKNVVGKLNAKINVESEELEGSTFSVVIPNTSDQ